MYAMLEPKTAQQVWRLLDVSHDDKIDNVEEQQAQKSGLEKKSTREHMEGTVKDQDFVLHTRRNIESITRKSQDISEKLQNARKARPNKPGDILALQRAYVRCTMQVKELESSIARSVIICD